MLQPFAPPPAPPLLSPSQQRAALALAEAIIPGSAHIPPADEATLARVNEVINGFAPVAVKAWAAAHSTLDAAAIAHAGRPFHNLSADRQEALIRRWEDDPILKTPLAMVALMYKFVHFDMPRVYGTLGGKLNVVKNLEQPRWLSQVHRTDDWADAEAIECDVVIVGTGAGGGVVGRELAERGHAVVFIEEGELYRRDDFDGSSVRAHQKFYRGGFTVGNTVMPIFMGRLVGGSTAINGGTCFRTPPWVLDRWCEDLDTDELAPERMKGYFDRVEGALQVELPELRHIGPISRVVARGCDALGWSHFRVPRNAPGCEGTGFCDFGCRTDARRSTNIAFIPPALERGSMLLTGLRADRVLVEDGRAVGIEGVSRAGKRLQVRGKKVVFAGGAIPTPLFLLKQRLCNRSGEVGKNLTLHPSGGYAALFDEEIRGAAHIPQGYGVDQFLREGILVLAAQPDFNMAAMLFPFHGRRLMETVDQISRIASFGLLVKDSGAPGRVWFDVGGHPAVTYNLGPTEVERMHKAMIYTGDICRAAGAKKLYPVVLSAGILETDRDIQAFRERKLGASDFALMSYHPLGTCRMGRDPKKSVVGLDHQAHDLPGFYIVDGSTVPTSLGVNPQLTIMAMAARAADGIAAALD